MDYSLINGDCLEEMAKLPDNSVDMVLTDPPYGTTACKWDSVVPLGPMWAQLHRVCHERSAVVMTASQPFTTALASSNLRDFRYCWVWDKEVPGGFNYARYQPMRQHEDILVFYEKAPFYDCNGDRYEEPMKYKPAASASDSAHMTHTMDKGTVLTATHRKKRSILRCRKVRRGVHPTQKPVELMSYLVKTYTKPGWTVLDFTMGSGSTGVACANLGRKFIGIELDDGYFNAAKERIEKAYAQVC